MATVTKDFVTRNGVTAGTLVKGSTLQSTVATGTAPLVVASTTLVTNLNAERLNGLTSASFLSNPMTTLGDLLVGGASGAATRVVGNITTQPQFLGSSGNGSTASQAALVSSTGSGNVVLATSPTLVTPTLGVAAVTSVNKVTITPPTTSAVLTIADGKTLTASNSLTFTGTDLSSVAFGTGGTVAYQGGTLGQFASTTSAALATVISDETGTGGVLMFNTSPAVSTSLTTGSASFDLINTTATTVNFAKAATALSIGATTGTTTVNNALVVTGDLTVNGTTTTINATTLTVDDKNVVLGDVAVPSNTTADGGGITLRGATDKTLNWVNATGAWTSSEDLDLATGKVLRIAGTQVLSATQYTGNAATATTAGGIAFTNGDVLSKTVTVSANATPTTIDSFAVATYTTAHYLIQSKQGTKMTATNLQVMWDGTDVAVSEWGVTDATAGAANATYTATHAAGTLTVSASSSDAATTNVVIKAMVTYVRT
jgi:hypothetical protein